MRCAPSLVTGGLLPFLVAGSVLLSGCPVKDDYYIEKDAPGVALSSGGMQTGGAHSVAISGRSGAGDAGGAPDAAGVPSEGGNADSGGTGAAVTTMGAAGAVARAAAGAGGAGGSGTEGCVTATNQGHEYTFCFSPLSQTDARANCGDLDMTLAVIDDEAEDTWIATTFSKLYGGDRPWAFIGANDASNEGEWRRADGVTFWRDGAAVSGTYANWGKGQPSDPGTSTAPAEDCLTLSLSDGTWNDESCDAEWPYVCESR